MTRIHTIQGFPYPIGCVNLNYTTNTFADNTVTLTVLDQYRLLHIIIHTVVF